MGGCTERLEALKALKQAGDEAWQDLHDWLKTARGMRQRVIDAGGDPDYDPTVPSKRGIEVSDAIAQRLGQALTLAEVALAEQAPSFGDGTQA